MSISKSKWWRYSTVHVRFLSLPVDHCNYVSILYRFRELQLDPYITVQRGTDLNNRLTKPFTLLWNPA